MWALNNSTRYRADRAWVRDVDGRETWLVAVRARYQIGSDGELSLADESEQTSVKLAPEIVGDGLRMMLRADTDLPRMKLATDVLVTGQAFAPEGRLVDRMHVRLRVGSVDKHIVVSGDRRWLRGGLESPRPFSSMPITYQRAFGGRDLAEDEGLPTNWYEPNPAGVGFSSVPSALYGQLAPNIEHPNALISSASDTPAPAGLGPLMGHWPQRRQYAGTYDKRWESERLPLLPSDFNPRFYQSAPKDQQCEGFLKGGEPVILEGLHPTGAINFALPRVSLAFETLFDDLSTETHSANLHTVVLEPETLSVSVVWHTHLECHSRVNLLRETQIWERRRLRYAQFND